jgi:hypothetical protein
MKRKGIFLMLMMAGFGGLLFSSSGDHTALFLDEPAADPCQTTNVAFSAGEEITYKVYYNWNFVWLSAGEVTFRINETGGEYHFSAVGRTYPSYEWFFKVRDRFDAYVDKSTLLPRLSVRDIQEGGYRMYDRVSFDQRSRRAVSLRGKSREEAVESAYTLDGCMHDLLSTFYFMRNLDAEQLTKGQRIPVKMFFDKEIHSLSVVYLGTESATDVKGMGTYRTHKISPQLIAGEVFKQGQQMTVWVSQDQNKIPVMIESPVSVGSVKVILKEHKGLRHPFMAKNTR